MLAQKKGYLLCLLALQMHPFVFHHLMIDVFHEYMGFLKKFVTLMKSPISLQMWHTCILLENLRIRFRAKIHHFW